MSRPAHIHVPRFLALMACLALTLFLIPGCGGGGGSTGDTVTPPTVGSTLPAAGFQSGGQAVTVSGTGFSGAGANAVVIGGAPATAVVTVHDTTITCMTGASLSTGPVSVVVTNSNGTGTNAGGYTYVAFPPKPDPAGDTQVDADAVTYLGEAPIVLCSGGNIYVTWIENRGGQNHVYFNRSTDGGATWAAADTQISSAPSIPTGLKICADGNNVYVTWVDTAASPTQVRMNASSDGGATWRAADVTVSQTPASLTQSYWHTVCCSGTTLTVAWPSSGQFFAQRTTDGGSTWLAADVPITDGGAVPGGKPELACVGSTVHVVWADSRAGDADIFYDRSLDGGATWGTDVRIDTAPAAISSAGPELCATGTRVHVAWLDVRNVTTEIWAISSADAGASWPATDQQVSRFAAGTASAQSLGLCCENNNVYVTWIDTRNGPVEPFFNRSSNGGTSYAVTDTRLNTGVAAGAFSVSPVHSDASQRNSQICCDDGAVHVSWSDNRAVSGLNVFLNSSADGGNSWQATDIRLDTDVPAAGNTVGGPPTMCCAGPFVYVAWRDDRNNPGSGQGDIAFRRTVP